MSCNTETKQIGEHEYSVTQWPADKALLMKFRLAKLFGPSITSIISVIGDKSATDNDQIDAMSNAFTKIFENNTPEDVVAIIKEVVIGVGRDGKRTKESSFNEFFSGEDMLEAYKVFVFVLQVNYSHLMKGQWADKLLAQTKVSTST